MKRNTRHRLIYLMCTIASLSACVSQEEKSLSMPPVNITLRVVGEQGKPVPYATAKVTQSLNMGPKPLCISISTFGGGGRNCSKYKQVPVFKGSLGETGVKNFTVSYRNPLLVIVALPCISGTDIRPYFIRTIPSEVFMTDRTLIVSENSNAKDERPMTEYPCSTTTPPLQDWKAFF